MGKSVSFETSSKTPIIMIKIILAVCLSVLAFETVEAIKCYQCGASTGGPVEVDTCGGFDSSTATCTTTNTTGENVCYKTYAKAAGVTATVHGCDVDVSLASFCKDKKNKCRKESGTTICCCDGDLCNSGQHLYGSVMILLASLLAQR